MYADRTRGNRDPRQGSSPGKSSLAGGLVFSVLVHLAILAPALFWSRAPVREIARAPLFHLDLRQIDFGQGSPPAAAPKRASPPSPPVAPVPPPRERPVEQVTALPPAPPSPIPLESPPEPAAPPVPAPLPLVLPQAVSIPDSRPGSHPEGKLPARETLLPEGNRAAARADTRMFEEGAAGPPPSAEPSLSAQNARRLYLDELRRLIEQHRDYPVLARRSRMEGEVLVRARLARDGTLLATGVEVSSGIPVLDRAALRAISRIKQYPPVPGEIAGEEILLAIPISYRLQ